MKRNLLLLIVLCCTMSMLAQNGKISYQAVVRDSENHLVYDTPLQVTVALANSETGTAVYSEQHNVTSNANGLISLLIGDGQNKQGHWEDVQWNTAWVTATIRKASDQTFLAEHHLPLSAVPYALYADFADSVNLAVLQDYLDEHHYVTEDELPAVQANADWTETNPDTASYIKNKPDLNDYEKKSELCGDVKECIKDTLGKYTTSNQIDTLLGAYYDTTQVKNAIHDTANAIRAAIPASQVNADWNATGGPAEILNKPDLSVYATTNALKDSLSRYVGKDKLNDTLNAYHDTTHIKQTLKQYLKTGELCDSVMNCNGIKTMQTDIATNTTNIGTNAAAISSIQTKWHNDSITLTDRIHDDSLTLAHRMDTVYKHLCDSVMNCTGIQSMQTDIATNTTNIGTNAAAISSIQTKWHNDSITLTDRIHDDSLTLAHRMDTVYKHLCDSVMNCTDIQTMQTSIETNTANIGTNAAAISSIQTKWHNDSITLTGKIRSDSSTVHGALVDSLKHYLDSAQVVRSIHDSIGNGTLSIKYGDNAPVTFTANQKTPSNIEIPAAEAPVYGTLTLQKNGATIDAFTANTNKTINIEVPTKLSQLSNDGGTYAKRDSVNVFTQANDFTGGTITVPSKFDIQSPPTAATCTQDAVNICDLLAVFDSLNRRMQKLENALADAQQELKEIKSTMPTLNLTASIPDEHIVSGETAVDITYTATILRSSATFTYSWYVNGVLQEGQTASTLTYQHDASGIYKVQCVANDGAADLKGDLTKTICLNAPLSMEYSLISGDSTDFGKIRILGSTATSAIWYNEDKKEVGRWNSGLTDVLPVGEYAVALSSSSCDRVDTVKITLIASPLCMAGHLNERYEKGVKVNGIDYVTEVKDIDGNWYKVVDIAGLCWTRENMRATRYYDGSDTVTISYGNQNKSDNTAYFYYSKGGADSVNVYGYLYNWTAATGNASITQWKTSANTRGVCPEGWHVPSYSEANHILREDLTNARNNAGMLAGSWPKETWGDCSTDAAPCNRNYPDRNITGFSAIQAGRWDAEVEINNYDKNGAFFWNCLYYDVFVYTLGVPNDDSETQLHYHYYYNLKASGLSVRCVRDDVELDPSLSLSSDPDGGTVSICGKESVAVTYTATINNDYPEDYTYTWSVNPNEPCTVAPSGNTCTVTYTMAGAYTVSCTATKNDNTIARSATISTTVDCEQVPNISYCTHDLKVTVWDTMGNPTSIQWGDETTDNSVTPYQTYHIYGTPGTYQLVVSNSDYSRTIPVTVDKPHTTCTVSNLLANEAGSGTVIDSVKDHQDNWYEVVQIGTQCWLKENMRCTTSPSTNATIVYHGDNNVPIISLTSKIAYWYNNDSTFYAPKDYGLLYNWCAAMDTFKTGSNEVAISNAMESSDIWSCVFSSHRRGICPQGWHVPTEGEWNEMESEVNDTSITRNYDYAGEHAGKLSAGCDWASEYADQQSGSAEVGSPGDYTNTNRNISGFSALPAGNFDYENGGRFVNASTPNGRDGYYAIFWTSSNCTDESGTQRKIISVKKAVQAYNYPKHMGMSVRCVRD